MPPISSSLGARTRRVEQIAKEVAQPLSVEESSSTESSSSEDGDEESDVKHGDIEPASDIENASNAENASDNAGGSIAKAENVSGDESASNSESSDASIAEKAGDSKHAGDSKSVEVVDAKDTEDIKITDNHIEHSDKLDNVSKAPQPAILVEDNDVVAPSTPLKKGPGSDVDMGSPPALQGASCMTGGVFRGKAYENVANHADFPDLVADVPTIMKSKSSFKILAHIEYGDALLVDLAPDFAVQPPIAVFFLTGTSLLAQQILKKMAQLHEKITSKFYYY